MICLPQASRHSLVRPSQPRCGESALTRPPAKFARDQKVHLIGAAGSGMTALAAVLRGRGCMLSGSDASAQADDPAGWIAPSHAAANVARDCALVVYSPAVPVDNIELRRAAALGIPAVSYPAALGKLMSERRGLAVAGTHGKSTTTAMTAAILRAANLDPTVLYGAEPTQSAPASRAGSGAWLLAEACEYRRHFLELRPETAVLLNIDWDHVDCFRTPSDVEAAFAEFVAGMPPKGLLLAAGDCPRARRVAHRSGLRYELFGLDRGDWRAVALDGRRGCYGFDILFQGRPFCALQLRVPGRHNVRCALAAAAMANYCGASATQIAAGLTAFGGLRRRLEWLGQRGQIGVVDDYAHHPAEVDASLAALREWFPGRRLCCVFQPHQASRTRALLDEFAQSLQNADLVVVANIFAARETEAAAGVRSADLASRVAAGGRRALALQDRREIRSFLALALRPGDVLVTMGAGDIGKLAHEFIQRV